MVLTDEEEDAILERAGLTLDERVDFRIATPDGDRLQERVGKYLEAYARKDPQRFELEFVRRSGAGPQHLAELRVSHRRLRAHLRSPLLGEPQTPVVGSKDLDPRSGLGRGLTLSICQFCTPCAAGLNGGGNVVGQDLLPCRGN